MSSNVLDRTKSTRKYTQQSAFGVSNCDASVVDAKINSLPQDSLLNRYPTQNQHQIPTRALPYKPELNWINYGASTSKAKGLEGDLENDQHEMRIVEHGLAQKRRLISTTNSPYSRTSEKEKNEPPSSKRKRHETWGKDVDENSDYQTLLVLNDVVDLFANVEAFECPLCFLDVKVGEGAILQDCLHSFCKKCLANAVQLSETAVIQCPFRNVEYSCESYLQEREIKSLVTGEVYEYHLQRSIAQAESSAQDSFHCKTPDCPGWCFIQDGVKDFWCPICVHNNCIICAAVHDGKDCVQYLNDLSFLDMNEELTEKNAQGEFRKTGQTESERKVDYHTLLALNKVNLVANVETFECPICFFEVETGKGTTLQECLHSFCKECLSGAVQYSETPLVKCPFQNDEYTCESHLQDREVKSLVTPEVYERHLQKSIALAENQAEDSFHCKTPDCLGWCFYEDAVNTFLCPVCKHTNCLTCNAIHEGKNCRQYQEDLVFFCDSNEEAKRTKEYLQGDLENDQHEMRIVDHCPAQKRRRISATSSPYSRTSEQEKYEPPSSKKKRHETWGKDVDEKSDYQTLLVLNDVVDLVANVETFECPVCFLDVKVGEGVILQDCLHSFCKNCLAGAIQFSDSGIVKCPFGNDDYSCESYLREGEVKSLVTAEVYDGYLQRSMALVENQAQSSFHCRTPDCPWWCLFEDNVNTFFCPVCKHTNCITCAAIHEGMNCKQYQDNAIFRGEGNTETKKTKKYLERMLENRTAMRCPNCKVIVMKQSGCDWMRCSLCRTAICWATRGPRWGPKGYGDRSGGCKCRVKGVRCHPKCRGCH